MASTVLPPNKASSVQSCSSASGGCRDGVADRDTSAQGHSSTSLASAQCSKANALGSANSSFGLVSTPPICSPQPRRLSWTDGAAEGSCFAVHPAGAAGPASISTLDQRSTGPVFPYAEHSLDGDAPCRPRTCADNSDAVSVGSGCLNGQASGPHSVTLCGMGIGPTSSIVCATPAPAVPLAPQPSLSAAAGFETELRLLLRPCGEPSFPPLPPSKHHSRDAPGVQSRNGDDAEDSDDEFDDRPLGPAPRGAAARASAAAASAATISEASHHASGQRHRRSCDSGYAASSPVPCASAGHADVASLLLSQWVARRQEGSPGSAPVAAGAAHAHAVRAPAPPQSAGPALAEPHPILSAAAPAAASTAAAFGAAAAAAAAAAASEPALPTVLPQKQPQEQPPQPLPPPPPPYSDALAGAAVVSTTYYYNMAYTRESTLLGGAGDVFSPCATGDLSALAAAPAAPASGDGLLVENDGRPQAPLVKKPSPRAAHAARHALLDGQQRRPAEAVQPAPRSSASTLKKPMTSVGSRFFGTSIGGGLSVMLHALQADDGSSEVVSTVSDLSDAGLDAEPSPEAPKILARPATGASAWRKALLGCFGLAAASPTAQRLRA